jgi:hypothetical protein
VELSAALPELTLYPYPVISEHVNIDDWARDPVVIRLIGSEYVKFLGALLRVTLHQDEGGGETFRSSQAAAE